MDVTNTAFEFLREQVIPELNTTAKLYRHRKTGAQVLSMEKDDENKVFGVAFYTPVEDSTGITHIIEHSVLCGSRKYPLKEPFIELNKGSLATFLNAFTYPDRTVYPLASQNVQDFYNLIDVYLDAVFYPRISPETLAQEGWHYDLDDPNAEMIYKGIVFNEMKGNYSDPDSLVQQYSLNALFSDTRHYSVDSGGDPRAIPDLTYAAFKRYHEIYYHPSNAMFYFYGDDDPAKRFELLEGYLKDFEAISIEKKPDVQPRWNAPRRQTFTYEGGEDAKAYVTLNWLLTDGENAEESLALGILNHILNGTPASPLQKALIESGLGEGLSGGGLDRDVYQYYYSLGLKNTATDAAASVETLMLNTLRDLVDNGIDPEMIEASMNTVEFSLRELNTGGFPRGLALFVATLRTWTYGGDPLAPISFEAPLNAIKARIARGEAYFESLIRRYFVDNPHRLTMSLIPEGGYQMNLEAAERARLDAIRAAMSGAQIEEVIAETHALREAQETPDAPESLALLPTVQLSDIDKQNKAIPITVGSAGGVPVVYHDIFTNGIAYIDVGFSLFALPMNYLPLLNLFSTALLEMGTQREDYVKFTQRIGRKTGGIDVSTLLSPMRTNRNESVAYLMVRGKGTTGQIADLLALYEDLLLNVKFDQQERFKQITLEAKSGLESFLLPGGARVINDRMRAGFNTIDWAEDEMGGVGQLFYLRDLIAQIETDWASVLAKLEDMRRLLINRTTMIINVTLDSGNYAKTFPQIEAFAAKLPSAAPRLAPWTPTLQPRSEGLSLPAQVNYVGWAGDLFSESYGVHGSYIAANNFLNSGYLWERIRMQGGAYGGFCAFDRFTGVWTFMSYRDPNTVNSLKAYQGTGAYLKALDLPERELQRIIIGGVSLMDAHLLPDAKGYTSFTRYLVGETDAMRQTMREQLLGTTLKDFQRLGEVLDAAYPKGITAILGSASAVDTVNDYIGGGLAVTKIG